MKMAYGSIQQKGRTFYYVSRIHGKQKWISLKTDDHGLARQRARQFNPPGDGTTTAWLKHLVKLGDGARLQLQRRERRSAFGWQTFWTDFTHAVRTPIPPTSRTTYRHWLDVLKDTAQARAPENLTTLDARLIADALRRKYLSAHRMIRFYRRIWNTLGLDADIWHEEVRVYSETCTNGKTHEFYRRLSTEEVRRVHTALLVPDRGRATQTSAADFADMVVVGYYTGLRLSDVAELELDEIAPTGDFLHLQPNKVRNSKKRRLLIPLVHEARTIVQRRRQHPTAGGYLFSDAARHRPTKYITAAFRTAGIFSKSPARASFHSLRATFISLMDEAGIPPHVTDAITGHAGGGMHARYTQPSARTLMLAVTRAIPPLRCHLPTNE